MKPIASSELILNHDGSIYHLNLRPEQLANDIIVVGDPGRVKMVSAHFDTIEHQVQNREFVTHTGTYKGKRISVIATGIGTDNIDIVLNELDALVNIDLKARTLKPEHQKLNIIRIGTSGGLQEELDVNTFVMSSKSIGFDGMLNFYRMRNSVSNPVMEKAFKSHMNWSINLNNPYFVAASDVLMNQIGKGLNHGITISAPGFYGPQGRILRLDIEVPDMNEKLRSFRFENEKIMNYEMESSAIYGLSQMLGHEALTICVIIANRYNKQYSEDYHPAVDKLIKLVLDRI
jgi:uridine phosphorylase